MKVRNLLFLLLVALGAEAAAETPQVLPLRQRAGIMDQWTKVRLERLLPQLMRAHEVDMWLIISREYNEDPLFFSVKPATWLAARRRTVLLFHDQGSKVERLAVSRYAVGDFFQAAWSPDEEPDQYKRLAALIAERDPQRIALNSSSTFALADGLSHSEHEALLKALPEKYRQRLVSGEKLAVDWLHQRSEEEMAVYPQVVRIARTIIHEGLSEKVIQPGVTTTEDVQWWYRERIRGLNLDTWFHPSVSVQRQEDGEHSGSFASRPGSQVILPGDWLHVDFGISYLGLNTDTQQHAYVLRPGESEPPGGLRQGMKAGNRLQDILTGQFAEGRTGNQVLAAALAQAQREGLEATIYTHPLGFHGHGAGPAIGMWDKQGGVPGTGDYPLAAGTVFSIELNVAIPVPEWGGQKVRVMLEEDAYFDGRRVTYLDGRQQRALLIGAPYQGARVGER